MTVHAVPKSIEGLISLASQSLKAAIAIGSEVNLKQNSAADIAADHYDLIGPPGSDPATAGKQGQLNQKRSVFFAAQTARISAVQAGRMFNGRAIDYLKGFLGRQWNPRWQAAGFTGGSLALPKDPLPLLHELRAYFLVNAAQEAPGSDLTAARAQVLATAIDQAIDDEAAAGVARKNGTETRDESLARLRNRIVGLRSELDQLLDSDDPRWRRFGFSRPIDRRIPRLVTGLTLRPSGQAGEIIVSWADSVGAENYRVSWQVTGIDLEPVEVGLFTDPTVLVSGLPSGKNVLITVTARNEAGETQPTQSAITVP